MATTTPKTPKRRPTMRRAVTTLPAEALEAVEGYVERAGPPGLRPSVAAVLRAAALKGLPLVLGADFAATTTEPAEEPAEEQRS